MVKNLAKDFMIILTNNGGILFVDNIFKQCKMYKRIFLIIFSFSLSLFSCRDEEMVRHDHIPYVYVWKEINLYNQQYNDLRFDRGFVLEEGGYKGIIIYRENASTFRAFERACPRDPTNPKEIVEVDDSGFFMIDKNCGAVFDFNGFPTQGSTLQPLKQYMVQLDKHMLFISSDPL